MLICAFMGSGAHSHTLKIEGNHITLPLPFFFLPTRTVEYVVEPQDEEALGHAHELFPEKHRPQQLPWQSVWSRLYRRELPLQLKWPLLCEEGIIPSAVEHLQGSVEEKIEEA